MVKSASVVIKKYGNRRMYDTSTSRYINLEDIAELVRNGTDVKVVDAKTGADLTSITLAQIIMEHAKEEPGGFPLELLRQIIVAGNHAGREVIMWYLKSAFDAYHKIQGALHTGITDLQAAASSPVDIMKRMMGATPPPQTTEKVELDELRRRLAELELKQRGETSRRPQPRRRKVRRAKAR